MGLGRGHSLELSNLVSNLVDLRIIEKVWVIIQNRARNNSAQLSLAKHTTSISRQLEHVPIIQTKEKVLRVLHLAVSLFRSCSQ